MAFTKLGQLTLFLLTRYGRRGILAKISHFLMLRCKDPVIKQKLWDAEFASGRYNKLLDTTNDLIYDYIHKYSRSGTLLDLGCGFGTTLLHNPNLFTKYTGVDISAFAISICQCVCNALMISNDLADFYVCDIMSFTPMMSYNIILFRESIYYLPQSHIISTLDKYSTYLEPDGVFIVRIWNLYKEHFDSVISLITSAYTVIDEYHNDQTLFLVFRK